jgi:hypothetical protein
MQRAYDMTSKESIVYAEITRLFELFEQQLCSPVLRLKEIDVIRKKLTEHFDPSSGDKFELTDEGIADLIVRAYECSISFDFCKRLAADSLGKYYYLDDFARDCLLGNVTRPKAKRGRKPLNESRDKVIVLGVLTGVSVGLPAFANESDKVTACSLVNTILQDKYQIYCNVVEIWKKERTTT